MNIGQKIKQLRIKNGLTLEELASRSELSKGFLSQLERDLTSPSIDTLSDILEALGTDLSKFFEPVKKEQLIFKKNDFFEDKKEEYNISWVVPNAQKNDMEPIIITVHPHQRSMMIDPHEGQEFGYVVSGKAVLEYGSENLEIKKGESFYLKGEKLHCIYNPYEKDVVILWVSTPPLF